MMIRASDLGWRTRGKTILQGATLEVEKGEVLGLIGPNGSGKSTLLRMLAGLLKPSQGHIELAGQELARMRQRDIARIIAFVAQQADTSDRITVRDAVELGRTPWLDALRPWSEEDSRHVANALATVEMQGFETRDWITLSGGERQRVHIARALAQSPQLLLLDEPTNHLDIHHQLSIMRLIGQLGLTTVVALHDLNQAMSCDRLGVLHQGRLIALGSPAEILTPDLLHCVFAVRATELIDPADGTRVLRFLSMTS
ncbi:ABC transporter ATP-binding protein [Paracoccus saliphilus]|uniref:ABC transporter ATP-binding protein n=2 Tax=Paracoccus saliphilus TaxID=405559 RepID=A0ABY7SAC7_9RHOB|nr:ABC transporter ATP-binding protein [Paracoccus saliphilus]WCR03492.1 ABC transporter ATP-binding protein [Paracoccus saliphilus]